MKTKTITDEVIRLYQAARAIEETGAHERWDENGGRRREYFELTKDLHKALNLKPHQPSVLDAIGSPPNWMTLSEHRKEWRKSAALGECIEAAIEANKGVANA